MKNILIISSSPRKNSNSHALAEHFAKGAADAGNQVELISLAGKRIEFCRGCFACQSTGRCVIRDDADQIEQKMQDVDVLVFATPIYYYEMSGQLKTMLDRGNPLYASDYCFRDVYVLSSAAEEEEGVDRRAVEGVKGWVECFEKAEFRGSIFAGGVTAPGEMTDHPALQRAYETGHAIS